MFESNTEKPSPSLTFTSSSRGARSVTEPATNTPVSSAKLLSDRSSGRAAHQAHSSDESSVSRASLKETLSRVRLPVHTPIGLNNSEDASGTKPQLKECLGRWQPAQGLGLPAHPRTGSDSETRLIIVSWHRFGSEAVSQSPDRTPPRWGC